MNDCPCHGCVPPKRHEACHDSCKEYIVWKQHLIDSYEERKAIAMQRSPGEGYCQAIRRQVLHNKRNRKR
jgi:hypothetical protein